LDEIDGSDEDDVLAEIQESERKKQEWKRQEQEQKQRAQQMVNAMMDDTLKLKENNFEQRWQGI
jgi:hypothetical protein